MLIELRLSDSRLYENNVMGDRFRGMEFSIVANCKETRHGVIASMVLCLESRLI